MTEDTPISPIEDIIEDARQGRPYILVDAEDPVHQPLDRQEHAVPRRPVS